MGLKARIEAGEADDDGAMTSRLTELEDMFAEGVESDGPSGDPWIDGHLAEMQQAEIKEYVFDGDRAGNEGQGH